jgi:hypothetical protein
MKQNLALDRQEQSGIMQIELQTPSPQPLWNQILDAYRLKSRPKEIKMGGGDGEIRNGCIIKMAPVSAK